jgi:hypothetical protein
MRNDDIVSDELIAGMFYAAGIFIYYSSVTEILKL